MTRVAIIGAGHAGLCVVAALQRRGVKPVVFDAAERLGDTWRARYDALVLNTRGDASVIPGVPVAPDMGEWPTRDVWADHIESAADALQIDRRCVRVTAVRPAPRGAWLIDTEPPEPPPPASMSVAAVPHSGTHATENRPDPPAPPEPRPPAPNPVAGVPQSDTHPKENQPDPPAPPDRTPRHPNPVAPVPDSDTHLTENRPGPLAPSDRTPPAPNSVAAVPQPDTHPTENDGAERWDVVVIATGRNRVPVIPDWPGRNDTSIELLHSSEFRCAAPFEGRRVLVVGGGNSGTEIAHRLAAAGVETTISIRTMPVFARREFLGTDLTAAARRAKDFPDRLIDLSGRVLQLLLFGRLSRFGIGPPEHRLSEVEAAAGATLDSGFVDDVKHGRLDVVDAVAGFEHGAVVTASGRRIHADVVIAATGSTPALDEFLPPDLLRDRWPRVKQPPFRQAPGLYTAGLNPATLTAFHPDFIAEAEVIADGIVFEISDDSVGPNR